MSDPFKFLGKAFEEARKSLAYRVEAVSLEFTEELVQRMDELGLKRVDLARMLDVSPPYISKLLDGAGNFTLATLVKIADAVGCDLKTHLATRDCESIWVDVPHAAIVVSPSKIQGSSEVEPIEKSKSLFAAADSNELALAA